MKIQILQPNSVILNKFGDIEQIFHKMTVWKYYIWEKSPQISIYVIQCWTVV